MRNGTVYSVKAGGKKHYLQVLLKKDFSSPGKYPVVAVFRKSFVEWDTPKLSEVASGGILVVTHVRLKEMKDVLKKEGWLSPCADTSKVLLKRGDSIHVPNGPTVPYSEATAYTVPFPSGPLDEEGLLELLKANIGGDLQTGGEFAKLQEVPLVAKHNNQLGFLIAGGMFFFIAGFTFLEGSEDSKIIAVTLCAIGLVIASLFFYYKDHYRDILKVYSDRVELFDQEDYSLRVFPYAWISSIKKMKMTKGQGKYARTDQALYMTFVGEAEEDPEKRALSRYPHFDNSRCIMAPTSGADRNEVLDTIISQVRKFHGEVN